MPQSKLNDKVYGSLKLYNNSLNKWIYVRVNEIGDLKYSARGQDHHEWLVCDGRSLLKTDYPELFGVIGTSFGSDDGLSFCLPDSRGRVPGAIGDVEGLTSRSLGDVIGEETTTLTVNNLPSHTHTGTTDIAGEHSHAYVRPTDHVNVTEIGPVQAAQYDNMTTPTTGTAGAHTHTFTTNATGNNDSFSRFQPTLFVGNLFICAKILS